jgi:hypothetical protein
MKRNRPVKPRTSTQSASTPEQAPTPPPEDKDAQIARLTAERDLAVSALLGVADGCMAIRDRIVALVRPG